jgi:hypothetical protein
MKQTGEQIKTLLEKFIVEAVLEHKAAILRERKATLRGAPKLPRCDSPGAESG